MTKVIFRPLIGERGFDKFFNEISNNVEIPFKRFLRIDVVDAEKSIEFIAELPGVKKRRCKDFTGRWCSNCER